MKTILLLLIRLAGLKTLTTSVMLCAFVPLCLFLTGCGGGGGSSNTSGNVNPGGNATDIQPPVGEIGAVSGIVTNSKGQGISGASVVLGTNSWATLTDANGTFIIRNITTGTYPLKIFKDSYLFKEISTLTVNQNSINSISADKTQLAPDLEPSKAPAITGAKFIPCSGERGSTNGKILVTANGNISELIGVNPNISTVFHLYDNGQSGDSVANDGTFTSNFDVISNWISGRNIWNFAARNEEGHISRSTADSSAQFYVGPVSLYLLNPTGENFITDKNYIDIEGYAVGTCNSQLLVNNIETSIDSFGYFKKRLDLTSTSTTVTVKLNQTSNTNAYTITRNIFKQDKTKCSLVYSKVDPHTGFRRIFDADLNILGSERILTPPNFKTDDTEPSISPDKTKIAFVRNTVNSEGRTVQNIYVTTCGGNSILTTITDNTDSNSHYKNPSWSPNGDYIAYSSDVYEQNYEIYIKNIITMASPIKVTNSLAADNSPVWDPTGKKIIFSSYSSSSDFSAAANNTVLWLIDVLPNIGNPSLVQRPAQCISDTTNCSIKNPDWCWANNTLIFQVESSCSSISNNTNPPSDICSNFYKLSGEQLDTPTALTSGSNKYFRPRWLSDCSKIIFIDNSVSVSSDAMKILSIGTGVNTVPQKVNIDGQTPDF